MTPSVEKPEDCLDERSPQDTPEAPLSAPVERSTAVQQLREAGFSEEQQDALTTALLRVLALWTQQATRSDLHAEQQALTQQLAQQFDSLRENLRRETVQHTDALRTELRSTFAQQTELLHTARVAPTRWRDVLLWLITVLLVLTTLGVLVLVLGGLGWL